MRNVLLSLALLLVSLAPLHAQGTIRNGDTFELNVGGAPQVYTQEFRLVHTVDDGFITVQYIGRVQAAGLTTAQLAASIEKKLKDGKIFTNPTVLLNPLRNDPATARSVIVSGAVRGSGRQPWIADLTLTAAIATAGGPSDYAEDKVTIIRNNKVQTFSRKAIRKDPSLDPKLLSGDMVIIEGEF